LFVVGKAVAGGMPCAVYGFGDDLAARMARAKDAAPAGHSGIGTTLTASLLALAALRATLAEVNTAEAAAAMDVRAARLASGLGAVFRRHALPWTVTRLGARMELQFRTDAPRNADEARAAMQPELEAALHLWWLNRGVLVTPFHGMLLVPPMAAETDLQRTVESFGDFTGQLA
jgi:glutamate-1-semialdehyde 2,1-aminomutase